jgi:hypothetical protein
MPSEEAEDLSIGNYAEQAARMRHAEERHGWYSVECEICTGVGCPVCAGYGILFARGDTTPCGRDCPFQDLRPS